MARKKFSLSVAAEQHQAGLDAVAGQAVVQDEVAVVGGRLVPALSVSCTHGVRVPPSCAPQSCDGE